MALESIQGVSDYLKELFPAIQTQQNILLDQIDPTINPEWITQILDTLPDSIKVFMVFRESSLDTDEKKQDIIDQLDVQLLDEYEDQTAIDVAAQVRVLLETYNVSLNQINELLPDLITSP